MIIIKAPADGKESTKHQGGAFSPEKLRAKAPEKWLERFTQAVALTIVHASASEFTIRQRASRELETIELKMAFWVRWLDEYPGIPDTTEAREHGIRQGQRLLRERQPC